MTKPEQGVQEIDIPEVIVDTSLDFYIIAVGASAGGLEALKVFFDNVPTDCIHSFVIIQHLSPDYKSLMAELLAKNTMLPINEVTNDMTVESGQLYLIPPKKNMTISAGRLILVNKPEGNDLNLPIDIFFRSLAEEYGEKSIAIILSGTGSDGTSGARAVKEAGGMVMVQDPEQAKFDGMPKSALNTGLVDYNLPVEQLPVELMYFITHPKSTGDFEYNAEGDQLIINRILHLIRKVTGLDFEHYKRPTISRRIARRISINKFHNHHEYLDFILESQKEANILAREFLIGVTKFFRDSSAWHELSKQAIRTIISAKSENDVFKAWCVGTSTGEEAYSLAMSISEELERQNKKLTVKIFATDLSNDHLDIGSTGRYPESIMADVSRERLNTFFVKKERDYQVVDSLRRMVIFSQHNILKDPPFNRMDITLCRNLLIYLMPEAQRKAIGQLHYALNRDGFLFMGSSEALGDYSSVFEEIHRKSKIFKNIQPATNLGMEPLNYPDLQKNSSHTHTTHRNRMEIKMADLMNETIAEEFGMAAVYIDENYNILHAIGEFKKFMSLPEKGFSTNLLKMLPKPVGVSLSALIRKSNTQERRILTERMKIKTGDSVVVFDLMVTPFKMNDSIHLGGSLLIFIPKEEVTGTAKVVKELTGVEKQHIAVLEQELQETRQTLNNVVQEIETSNEELQATNEELLAANEELQSTNEELQSVNEELHTVNAELQQKIEDLASLNADMDNLLKSTEIGTIFLDREMRIRKFTPAIKEHFNLRDNDINRPIHHFANNFDNKNQTFERVQRVLDTGKPLERELQSKEGNWFLKRITPYYNSHKKIDGAVISFVAINEQKKSEFRIRKNEQELTAIYDNAPDMFASFDAKGFLIRCNSRMINNLGYKYANDLVGKHLSELYVEEDVPKADSRFEEFRESGSLRNAERELKRKDDTSISVSVNAEMIKDVEGELLYSIASIRDITERKEAQKLLLERNNAFEQLLEGTMAGYWDWMIQENTEYLSPSFKEMFGYEDHEMENSPESWQKIIHPDDLPAVFETFNKHVASKGEIPYDNEVRYYHKDGSIVYVICRGKVIEWDGDGKPIRMVGSHVDITQLKNIENELHTSNRELEQFAYIASHDLQEPLNTITDYVRLFKEEYKENIDEDANKYIEFIVQASTRMSKLVKGVLGYSRIGRNIEVEKIDCNKILEEVQSDLQKRISDTNANITSTQLPVLQGYRIELHSLFLNILSNAIKFRKENTVPEINIHVEEDDSYWRFSVSDNGIGIAEKNQTKVFKIFQRLNNFDSYEGTGIGLAKCKKIVELHDGEIGVTSVLDEGSTFHFTIKKYNQ